MILQTQFNNTTSSKICYQNKKSLPLSTPHQHIYPPKCAPPFSPSLRLSLLHPPRPPLPLQSAQSFLLVSHVSQEGQCAHSADPATQATRCSSPSAVTSRPNVPATSNAPSTRATAASATASSHPHRPAPALLRLVPLCLSEAIALLAEQCVRLDRSAMLRTRCSSHAAETSRHSARATSSVLSTLATTVLVMVSCPRHLWPCHLRPCLPQQQGHLPLRLQQGRRLLPLLLCHRDLLLSLLLRATPL